MTVTTDRPPETLGSARRNAVKSARVAYYRSPRLVRLWRNYGGFLVVGVIWALVALRVSETTLPSPAAVWQSLESTLTRGVFPAYVVSTLKHVGFASLTGIAIGIPLGVLVALSRRVADFVTPLLTFFQALSGIAWIPMLIIWFGFSEKSVILVIIYAVIFPVVLNTATGVRTIPSIYLKAARTMGATRWQTIRDVIFPGALPNVFTGVRLGIAYGWRAAIAAEIIISTGGLGLMIFEAREINDIPRIVLGMITIGTLWVVLDRTFLKPLERATIERWGTVS